MSAKIIFSLSIFCWIWIGFAEVAFAQTIVGMGTENPNPNAVLELVSENLDQGFLVPRFTTGQRTASSFAGKLSDKDNGLLVFDTDEGEFYYWYDGGWQQGIGTGSLDGTGTVWYTGNAAPRNNEGKNGDFYIHTLSGDIYRKQNGVFNVIGNISSQQNQYTAGTGINIDTDNTIINTGDLSNTNEIQDLQLTSDELKITNNTGATSIDLSAYKNNDTNELIQEVSLTGETLRISDAGGDYDVDLGSLGGGISIIGDPASISDFDLLGNTLRITEDGVDHDVDLSSFQKTTLTNGNILVGNASNVATRVTISGDLTLNSDGTMIIKLDAVTTAKIINDAVDKDKIHANVAGTGLGQNADGSLEIKTTGGLQIAADQLSLANTGNGEVLIGNGSTINAQTISGDATLANDGTASVVGLQGQPIATIAPASGNLLTWNGTAWEPQAPSGGGGSGAAWYSGNNAPNPGNPSGAVNGDYFYRNSTGIVYRKVSGAWVEQGKWTMQSVTTVSDVTITDITTPTLYIGTGVPSDGPTNNGKPGDLYYDSGDDVLYIKKNLTDWANF